MTTTTARKKPADRKAKASTDDSLSVTFRGVDLQVPTEVLNDFELLDDLDALDQGDVTRLPRLLRRVAGEKYRDLLETARDSKTGRVSIDEGGNLVAELLAALDPNSFGSRVS